MSEHPEPIVRVYPRNQTDNELADAMTWAILADGQRWPEPRASPFWRIDREATRQGVRDPAWRQRLNDGLREYAKKGREQMEQAAAWAIITEALNRIDELEAELEGRGNAPTLGGPLA